MTKAPVTAGTVFDAIALELTRPASARITMPVDDFRETVETDDGYRYELVNDLVLFSPANSPAERGPNGELEYWLRRYRDTDPQGSILDDTLADQELVTHTGIRRPDRAIWTGLGRCPQVDFDPPSIVVEFVSITTVDRKGEFEAKRHEYGQLGVAEYWILDRFRRTMAVCRGDAIAAVVHEGGVHRTPLLPGFELAFGELLALAERYAASSGTDAR